MSTIRRVTASIAAVGVSMLAAGGALLASPPAAQADPAADATAGKLLLMLDASGSMKAKDPSGLTKIAAAKKALTSVVGALPTDAQVGLRVYGATQPGVAPGVKPGQAACTDTQLVAPITTLDKPALTKAINGFAAKGETPISYSLTQALKDLGPTGKRNIVLVSDGEESCVPDPCPVIKKLIGNGIDLQIDTVGFGVNAKARKQLQCLADTGNGTYYDARDAGALTTSLTKLSQRALRPFTVSGTPVKATTTAADAPELTAGLYRDTYASDREPRYYRIKRTIPGSTLHVGLSSRPPMADIAIDSEAFLIQALKKENLGCDLNATVHRGSTTKGADVASGALVIPGQPTGDTQKDCVEGDTVLVSVTRRAYADKAADATVQLLVMEEPPVTDAAKLPAPAPQVATPEIPSGTAKPVTGGGGFDDAVEITQGTYTDVNMPGEQLFYRVRAGYGQQVHAMVDWPATGSSYPPVEPDNSRAFALYFRSGLFAPDRTEVGPVPGSEGGQSQFVMKVEPKTTRVDSPTITYRNREVAETDTARPAQGTSLAGWYYVTAQLDADERARDLRYTPMPIRIRVTVTGEPAGAPQYAEGAPAVVTGTSSPSDTATASATGSQGKDANATATAQETGSEGGVPVWVWIVGGVVVLAAAGAIALGAMRRGSHAGSHQ
jgi:Ca-activated chloride channel family protein